MEEEMHDYNNINNIREQIENMNKFHQIEVLRILTKNKDVIINENKYGIHINLSELEDNILHELTTYIKYVNSQESFLSSAEKEKESYKNKFFQKDNKELTT
jgi:hypothetical protein